MAWIGQTGLGERAFFNLIRELRADGTVPEQLNGYIMDWGRDDRAGSMKTFMLGESKCM